MLELFRYIAAALRYPESRQQGFLRMGLGIDRRRGQFSSCWDRHFTSSKAAQRAWWGEESNTRQTLAILGAGKLFDVDQGLLAERCSEVHFVDANPLCIPEWNRFSARHPAVRCRNHIAELTGILASWIAALRSAAARGTIDETLEALRALSMPRTESPLVKLCKEYKPDRALSLNLLSQLSVMWQNAVERTLVDQFGLEVVSAQEARWLSAYAVSARTLIRQHLNELGRSGAKSILLVTDAEYLYYPAVKPWKEAAPFAWIDDEPEGGLQIGRWEDSPEYSMTPEWRSECHSVSALLDVNVENAKLVEAMLPEYAPRYLPSWVWHICPESDDASGNAVVHRVRAIEFTKK